VPHRPPCNGTYGCRGKSAAQGACWEVEGRPVCGVVAPPEKQPPAETPKAESPPPAVYSYPGGLPRPIDRSSRVVGHFQVSF
jgi:hypothetical protein